jgi:1-acyl-sn-glycerol-3-phosphate acyltransferase
MFRKWLGQFVLKISGWRLVEAPPAESKYVLIAAPHTSNWDLVYMLAFAFICEMRISWMGKDSIFNNPVGGVFKALGGIPIDRSKATNVVGQMAQEFNTRDELVLAVPAAGTRSKREYWKSGFYWIAKEAKVPIVMGYLDYGKKQGGFAGMLEPTGDLHADMNVIRAAYADKTGLYPAKQSTIRLKDEPEPSKEQPTE